MGVKDLWAFMPLLMERRYLPEIALREGYQEQRHNTGVLILGVDVSTWFYECRTTSSGCDHVPRYSEQTLQLESLFYRLCWLSRANVNGIFVFDGPNCPDCKEHKCALPQRMVDHFQDLVKAFGFKNHIAPGEAEAELAYLNQIGKIDLVLTKDSDIFLFGVKQVMRRRDPENECNQNSIEVYTANKIATSKDPLHSPEGLLFLAIMNGCDYAPTGLRSCGLDITRPLGRGPLPRLLFNAINNLSGSRLSDALKSWNKSLRDELTYNISGLLHHTYPDVAQTVPEDFPSIDVLKLYRFPVTSRSLCPDRGLDTSSWSAPSLPDTWSLALLCNDLFDWGPHILERFQSSVWEGYCIRRLAQAYTLPPSPLPLGPKAIRYITSAKRYNESPSIYIRYCVDLWLGDLPIEAFNAIRDQLPSGRLAPGASTITSLRVWIPDLILRNLNQVIVREYHIAHPDISFGIDAQYIPILSKPIERDEQAAGLAPDLSRGITSATKSPVIDLTECDFD